MSTSLDIPSSSGIVIVDNTSSNENLVTTVQVPREHLPIHHIQQQHHHHHQHHQAHQIQTANDNHLNHDIEYTNNVIDTSQNALPTGVINFTANDVLSNTQVLKFVSDDSGTILDQTNEEIQNYCTTGRLITNPTSKVHVISNVPFGTNNKQHGTGTTQQTINLVSNGKITQGVNFVNAYYAKPATMQAGKILNLPKGGTTSGTQIQQHIINKGGNQLIQKVSVPRNVQFVTRTANTISSGNIIMSRTTGQNNNVIQSKGQQILVPHNNIKTATITNNIVKNNKIGGNTSAQLQSVKIYQGNAQSKQCTTTLTTATGISGIKTIIPSQPQKITGVKTNSTTIGSHKFAKQFTSLNNNYCSNTATINAQTFISQHQQQTQQMQSHQPKGTHLTQQQANLIYTACSNSSNASNNGSVTKVQTVQYQRAGSLNNVLIQGKGIIKGNKYVVQHNPTQTHIVLPSQQQSAGNLVAVSGTVTNVQQLKTLPHSFTTNNSGTIKYVNAQGNVTQPPTKVRAIFQQHSSPILQNQILDQTNNGSGVHQQHHHETLSSPSMTMVNMQQQHSGSPANASAATATSMEEMIVNGTIMTEEEMSARILQSLSQKTIFTNNRSHNQNHLNNNNNNNNINNNKIYTSSPNSQHATKVYLSQNQEHNVHNNSNNNSSSSNHSNNHNINNNNNVNHQIYHISGIGGHGARDIHQQQQHQQHHHHHHHHDTVKPSATEKYFKVSSCDLSSTTTTFIDNIPLTSTRGDNIPHGQRAGEDDDELIGEEVRPAPMNVSDGKIHLVQVIVQDHTYAAVQPEQTKKIANFTTENVATLSATNIQQAGLNYNFKTNNNDDDANSAISTGSRNGANHLDNDLGEETETAPEAEGEDDSVTRCICDLTHDDGYMICCDKCSAWQHVDCMGIDRQNIPEEYKCEVCQPRPVDKQRARNLQLMKRKEQQNVILLNQQQQQQQQHSALENNTQLLGQQMERTNLLNKSNSLQNVGKKHKQTVKQRKAELASQFAQQKRERKLSSRSNGKRRESKKISKRKSKMTPEQAQIEKTSNLRQWIENYEQAITNHYSPELRARLHAIGKQNQIIKELIPSHLKHTTSLEHRCTTVPHAGGKILISTSDLAASVPIVEIRGKYMLSSQFRQQQTIPSTTGNVRNHQYNRKPGPFIFFYRLPNDGPEICIDTRTYGNEARFVRRSCRPNAEILHSIEKGAIHLYIVSLSNIIGGTEITIKHEPHDLTAISRGSVTAPTSTVCACGCPKDCIFAIATANHLNIVSQKAMKKNGHLLAEETRMAYRRSKSLMSRGRSTSSSGESNASLLSPNTSSMSTLPVLQPMQPITIPMMTPSTTPLSDASNVFSPQPQPQQQPILQPQPQPLLQSQQQPIQQQPILQQPLPQPPPLISPPSPIIQMPQPSIQPPATQQSIIQQPIIQQSAIPQPATQTLESISMPSPSRPSTLNIMPPDQLMVAGKMPSFPVDICSIIPQMNVVEKSVPLPPPPPQPLLSPVQSVMPMPMSSPILINQHKPFSPQKCNQQQVVHQIHKKTPSKVRQISFSEETSTPIISMSSVGTSIILSQLDDLQKSTESSTTPMQQKVDKPPKEPKEKDSPKLTREERKMQAIMKAFEKMEKNQERKQQLKQNKSSVTKRRNSSPSSPRRYKEDVEHEKNYQPRKKKRKGSKSYQHLSNPKIRRRSRMNSGDSDLLTSEESTSLLSPPLPAGPISYNSDDIKSPSAMEMHRESLLEHHQTDKNVNSAAGLLLSLSHAHSDSQESSGTMSNMISSPNNNNNLAQIDNNNTLMTVSTTPLVSSACLLVEAAVAPLEQTQTASSAIVQETEIKFHVQKTKTKKSIMNDWLNQSDSNMQNDETTNLDSLVQVAATMCNNLNSPQMVTHSQQIPVSYAIQEEPHNLSMAAKKVEEFIYQNDVKMTPPEEEDVKWHHPNNIAFSNVSEPSTAISFATPPGVAIQDGSGSAAKKRWLRQAISEECNDEASSPPNGYTTPLKKRRFARQCSELPTPDDLPPNHYTLPSFSSNDIQQIKSSPEASPLVDIHSPIKCNYMTDGQISYTIKIEDVKKEITEEPMTMSSVLENHVGHTQNVMVHEAHTFENQEQTIVEPHVPHSMEPTFHGEENTTQYSRPVENHSENEESYEQDDEIDIVSSPPPGEKIVAEDNLVKIEPEDENEKDEKIDVVEDITTPNNIISDVKDEPEYDKEDVEVAKLEKVEAKVAVEVNEDLKHEIEEIFGSEDDKQDIKKLESDIKTEEEILNKSVEDLEDETDDMEAQIEKCINATDESINDADDEADGDEEEDEETDDEHENVQNESNIQCEEHIEEHEISVNTAEVLEETKTGEVQVAHEELSHENEEAVEDEKKKVTLELEDEAIENISNPVEHIEEFEKSFESNIQEQIEVMEVDKKEEMVDSQCVEEVNVEHEVQKSSAEIFVEEIEMECQEDSRNTSTPIPPAESDSEHDEPQFSSESKPPSLTELEQIIPEDIKPEPVIPPSKSDSLLTTESETLSICEPRPPSPVEPEIKKFHNEELEAEKPTTPVPLNTSNDLDFDLLPTADQIETEECNNVNDEIADIQKRLHSFHTENILILKSRNKKTKPNISSVPLIRSPASRKQTVSPPKPTTPPPMPPTKAKKSVQLNFDLSVQDDMTVNVKLKDKNEVTTVVPTEDKLCNEKREIKEVKYVVADIKECRKNDISKEERHHTRWDKPDDGRYDETQPKVTSSIYPYLNNNNNINNSNASNSNNNNNSSTINSNTNTSSSSTSSLYGISSLSVSTSSLAQLPPTIHIPPNTPASHIQYYNAFYNKYSTTTVGSSNSAPIETTENTKLKYPSFSSFGDYLDTSATGTTTNNNKITSFHTSAYSSLEPQSVSSTQSTYYSMSSNGPSSLISSFLSKSYSSDQLTSNLSSIQPPKLLSRAQSADPRLNPNLNVPEPPPAPKRKLSINEYRKRKQQSESSNTNNGDKTISKSSSGSSLLNDCLGGSGGKSDSSIDVKDTLRQIDDKEKEVLFSPAPTELEMQQEILSERMKSFKSLHGLSSLPPSSKADDNGTLSFLSPLKDKDLESSLARSNRLSTGSNCSTSSSSSSLSSINSEINPPSPLSASLSTSPLSSSHKH